MSVGTFVWYDLATSDPAASASFYAGVVGWTPEPVADMPYTLFKTGSAPRAGVHRLDDALAARGVPPHWSGHIHVEDVDASLARAVAAGGTCQFGPADAPGVGRFAALADPSGAHLFLFTPTHAEPEPPIMSPGSIGWRELRSGDPVAALAFYTGLFGWEPAASIDMGPMGTYQLFGYGGMDRGGIMQTPPETPPHWLFYIAVEAIDPAMSRVLAGGGTVLHGPQEVPGGALILICRDPQGGIFALVSPPVSHG